MKKKILVVVDMQNDFISGSLGSERGKEIVPRVLEKVNTWDGTIIATRDTHHENYLETQEGIKLPVPHCIENTHGWEIENSIKEAILKKGPLDCRIIDKDTFGSYSKLPECIEYLRCRDSVLKASDLEFTVVGLCTDICVVSNVMILKARYPEAKITVDASCCGGVTCESHRCALETMKSCQIEVENENL